MRFTLERPSEVALTTNGQRGDTQLRLFSDSGKKLAIDDDSGRGLFSKLVQRLDAGTYFVRVSESGMDERIDRYSVGFVAKALRVFSDPDGSADRALDLGRVIGRRLLRNTLGGSTGDQADFYRFSVFDESFLQLDFDPQGSSRLGLFDAAGDFVKPIAREIDPSGRTADRAAYLLDPGVFYVRVMDSRTLAESGLVGSGGFEENPALPGLGDLPILSPLFRGRRSAERYDLRVFVTPTITAPHDFID
jgi:hypothetical protein